MNFEFSQEQEMLRDQARSFLSDHSTVKLDRDILEGNTDSVEALWKEMAQLGWMGAAIGEEYGGSGLGHLELCVLAEEMGRSLLPTAFSSSVYLATEAIVLAGTAGQKSHYLPELASGQLVGTLAVSEGNKMPSARSIEMTCVDGKISGTKIPVADGMRADFAVVVCSNGWYIVDLNGDGVTRRELKSLDPGRAQAEIVFDNAPAQSLNELDDISDTSSEHSWRKTQILFDRAAVFFAFEQVGGALACLDQAKNYALNRFAFGRPIATYQAIKHKLADMYVAATLARSNSYYGAWALNTNSSELALAASTARVSATKAFDLCASENIQTHGGMGFTWEFDCHLYYRRARSLAINIGHQWYWENRLVNELQMKHQAA